MDRVTLSHDSDGRPIADVEISVDIGYLDDEYQWLLAQCLESNPDPVEIKVNSKTMKVELEPGLEGLLNFLESIRELIFDAQEEKAIEEEECKAMHDALREYDRTREEALENHFDQREHFKEGM